MQTTTSQLISLEQATRMLPLVRPIATDIQKTWHLIIERRTTLQKWQDEQKRLSTQPPEVAETIKSLTLSLNDLIDRINGYIREIESLGCFVEQFQDGVVNFPSLYNGRKIFLCWKLGDETINHWHELDEVYGDRIKIFNPSFFLRENKEITSNDSED